jgi:hypothetical protein
MFGRRDVGDEPEVEIVAAPVRQRTAAALPAVPLDLSGQQPIWLLVGGNGAGKTTFARWVGDRRDSGPPFLAALDPQQRALAGFFDGVAQPPSYEPAQVQDWLGSVLDALMEERQSAVLDMGGGDTTLAGLVEQAPDLAGDMEKAGAPAVAAYFLGPRVDDLVHLAALTKRGFTPTATLLVLNEARVERGGDPAEAFDAITRHHVFSNAIARGAAVVRMPALYPQALALEIERKRLHFSAARDGIAPPGITPVRGLDCSRVRAWLQAMETAFAPVGTWLP